MIEWIKGSPTESGYYWVAWINRVDRWTVWFGEFESEPSWVGVTRGWVSLMGRGESVKVEQVEYYMGPLPISYPEVSEEMKKELEDVLAMGRD
jgi:hypothetical protein